MASQVAPGEKAVTVNSASSDSVAPLSTFVTVPEVQVRVIVTSSALLSVKSLSTVNLELLGALTIVQVESCVWTRATSSQLFDCS